jgi:hypothetical protein
MTNTLKYHKSAERPEAQLWILDDDGSLIDFATGYSFSLKIGQLGSPAVVTKTSGITGATGAGIEPTGTPNVTVAWSFDELSITPGLYTWQLTATNSGNDRVFQGDLRIDDIII